MADDILNPLERQGVTKEQLELQQKALNLAKEDLAVQKELISDLRAKKDLNEVEQATLNEMQRQRERLRQIVKDEKDELELINQTRKELNAQQREEIAASEKHRDVLKDISDSEKDRLEILELEKQIAKERYELMKKTEGADTDALKDAKKAAEDATDALDKFNESLDDTKKKLSAAKNVGKDFAKSFSNMLKGDWSLSGAMDVDSVIGGFKKLGPLLGDMELLAANFKDLAFGLLKGIVNAIKDLAFELGNAESEFMKSTGASREFANSLTTTYEATRQYGVSVKEVGASMESLHGTYTDFTMMDRTLREELTETGAVLARLGVSNQAYAEGIQNATKMFGVTAGQADDTMRELTAHAMDLGVSPQKLTAEFASAGGALAKFGDQGVKAFKDLQYISKITGLEMEKVLGVANKFDTFEDAAEQTGKLNAALGGNFVNAMDMMMETDPAERFNMVRDAITQAGLSFDEMSYYQKQFYTESLGLSDVGDLAMMLSGNMEGLAGDIGKNSDELIDMKERALEVASFQERMNALFAQMIPIIEPLIEHLHKFTLFLSENADVIKKVVGVMTLLVGVMLIWTGVGSTAGAAALGLSGALIGIPGFAKDIYEAFMGLVKFLAGPFVDAFVDIKQLWTDFTESLTSEDIEAAMAVFSFLGTYLKFMFLPIIGGLWLAMKGIAIILEGIAQIVLGVTWAFIKLSNMIDPVIIAFTDLLQVWTDFWTTGQTVTQTLEKFAYILFEKSYASSFLEGVGKFAESFALVGTTMMGLTNPIAGIIQAFTALGEVIFKIFNSEGMTTFFETVLSYVDKLMTPINTIVTAIASMFQNIFNPAAFTSMATSIAAITQAIAEMPLSSALSFTASMGAFSEASTALATVSKVAPGAAAAAMGPAALANTTATVINTREVVVKTQTARAPQNNQQMKVNIQLDGLDLVKFLQGTVVEKIGELSRDALIG